MFPVLRSLLAGRFARGLLAVGRLVLGLEILAGLLVDHLHRQPHLAAVVEPEHLDLDLVASSAMNSLRLFSISYLEILTVIPPAALC